MIWALHGMFGSPVDWDFLGDGVCAVHLWAKDPLAFDAWAAAFCEEVAATDEAPVLLGYSMGGRLALHALLERPELWRGAVIASANPGVCADREARLVGDLEWGRKVRAMDWDELMAEWNAQAVFGGRPRRGFGEASRERVARAFDVWSLGRQADLRERLGEVRCPVLWITGDADAKFTEIAHGLEEVEHEIWKGGHRFPWDDENRFRERILEFQNAVVGRRSGQ